MKNLIILILTLSAAEVFAQHKVEITIKNIDAIKGSVLVAVYNTEKSFLKKSLTSKAVKVTSKEVTIVFENVSAGNYAVTTFHDVDDNKKLDTNFIGIPSEPYGFSNDVMGTFGPPSFEQAKVSVTTDKKLVINLR